MLTKFGTSNPDFGRVRSHGDTAAVLEFRQAPLRRFLWPLALHCDGHAWCTGSREAEAKWLGLIQKLAAPCRDDGVTPVRAQSGRRLPEAD